MRGSSTRLQLIPQQGCENHVAILDFVDDKLVRCHRCAMTVDAADQNAPVGPEGRKALEIPETSALIA